MYQVVVLQCLYIVLMTAIGFFAMASLVIFVAVMVALISVVVRMPKLIYGKGALALNEDFPKGSFGFVHGNASAN